MHAHNEVEQIGVVLDLLGAGADVALVSDAGTPVISDPGGRLVAAVSDAGFDVHGVPGPSAGLAALVVSGFDVSRFRFEGFLPRKGAERRSTPRGDRRVTVPDGRLRGAEPGREDPRGHSRRGRGRTAASSSPASSPSFTKRCGGAVSTRRARGRTPSSPAASTSSSSTPRRTVRRARRPTPARRSGVSSPPASGCADATTAVEVLLGVAHRVAYEAALAFRKAAEATRRGLSRSATRSLPRPSVPGRYAGDVSDRFFVTTPIYYVNDAPHIGTPTRRSPPTCSRAGTGSSATTCSSSPASTSTA